LDNDTHYAEKGLGGVTINAYRANGTLAATTISSTTCGSDGTYSLAVLAGDYPIRVEFVAPTPYAQSFTDNSNVRFFTAATSGVNYGVSKLNAYADKSTMYEIYASAVSSEYPGASVATVKAWNYQGIGPSGSGGTISNHVNDTYGTIRGITSDKKTKKIYYSQGLKRFTKYESQLDASNNVNPNGKIYVSDFNSPNPSAVSVYADLEAIGFSMPSFTAEAKTYSPVNDWNGCGNTITFPNYSPNPARPWEYRNNWEAYYGHVGLGDIDMNEDNTRMYVINKSTFELVSLPTTTSPLSSTNLQTANTLPNAIQSIGHFTIPYPGDGMNGGSAIVNNNGAALSHGRQDWYVDGIGVYNGKIYVGVTNPRQYAIVGDVTGGAYNITNGSAVAVIYAFDPSNGSWSRVMTEDLSTQLSGAKGQNTHERSMGFPFTIYDIAFDSKTNEMAISTRCIREDFEISSIGYYDNFFFNGPAYRCYSEDNGSTWQLEKVGTIKRCGADYEPPKSAAFGNNPTQYNYGGNGGFWNAGVCDFNGADRNYYDAYEGADGYGFKGGIATFPGSSGMLFSYADPQNSQSSGATWINHSADANNFKEEIFQANPDINSPYWGKGAGVSDIELIYDIAPIVVGNRIWSDTDADGIQDAGENGMDGIIVELWQGATKVGQTTTATLNGQSGSYLFNKANVNLNSANGILESTAYEIRIPNISGGSKQAALGLLSLTSKDLDNTTNGDARDSDGTISGTNAVVAFTSGKVGENNHNYDFGFKTPICGITLKPTVSGCYQNGGASKATVSVEVAWENALSGNITVTLAGQTRTIIPGVYTSTGGNGVIVSPQVVAFEIPADGVSNQALQAFFGASYAAATCKDSKNIDAPMSCTPLTCTSGVDLAGTVFNDFNADGIKGSGETNGLGGVTVTAIACDGTTFTTVTDSYGKYKLTPTSYPVRVEFSSLPSLYGQGTPNGTNGKTSTQFVNSATCNVDFGVLNQVDYCQTEPRIFTAIQRNGNGQAGGDVGPEASVVWTDYTVSGLTPVVNTLATQLQVGTIWGNTYNKNTKNYFRRQ
jgi:hypothetical protein